MGRARPIFRRAVVILAAVAAGCASGPARPRSTDHERAAPAPEAAPAPVPDPAPAPAPKPEGGPPAGPFFVAPGGDDANPGTDLRPFRTLEAARDAVRRSPQRGKEPVRIVLLPGRYARTATFELGAEDSGAEGAAVVYAASEQGGSVIDGGVFVPAEACSPVKDADVRERLVPEACDKVLEIDLAALGVREFGEYGPRGFSRPVIPAPNEIFIDGEPQRVARWPNDKRIPLGKVIDSGSVPRTGDKSNRGAKFRYVTDRALRWSKAGDMYVSGIFGQSWADDAIRVAKVDVDAGTITTVGPHLYGFRNRNFTTWCAANLLEEIDEGGEYFVDRVARKLYFLPSKREFKQLQLSVLAKPLVALEGASHIRVEGLVLENARGAGVTVKGGSGVVVAGCTIRNIGGGAVNVTGGTGHAVRSSDIYNAGAGGVTLSGGDRKTLTPARHVVENCDIRRVNRWYKTYRPCVALQGVGNAARRNRLHHVPGQAILFGGNDHVMELNEIDHAVTDMSDMGSIYTGRNPSVLGHVIRHNFFHDMHDSLGYSCGVQAIFIDDDNLYTAMIYGNVFYKTGSNAAIKFNGGGGGTIANNMFIDCPAPVQGGDKRHVERAIKRMRDPNWKHKTYQKITREVDVRKEPYRSRYPYLLDTFENAFNYGTPQWNNYVVKGDHSQFVDARALDFTLKEGSPVLSMVARGVVDRVWGAKGTDIPFKAIPFKEIGLRVDEFRKALARTE